MTKSEFIDAVKPILKKDGYRKKGFYWYKQQGEFLLCINVQGSAWDKDDYYVELGLAVSDNSCTPHPTVLHWEARHRVFGRAGQVGITPDELFEEIKKHHCICRCSELPQYLDSRKAERVAGRFWF